MNEFEVGDWVIYAEFELCQVLRVVSERYIQAKSTITSAVMKVRSDFCIHATQEEIKAGKRL